MKKEYILSGLKCANCALKMEEGIKKLDGIKNVRIDFVNKTLKIEIDDKANLDDMLSKIKSVIVSIEKDVVIKEKYEKEEKKEGYNIAFAFFVYILAFILRKDFVFLICYVLAGYDILLKAFKNIKKGQVFDENFLMSIATLGAIAIGEISEACSVMLFYKIGEFLQDLAVEKSRRSIKSLLSIRPDYANLAIDEIKRVDPHDVKVGDLIVVKPGEKVPLDGVVVEGKALVDTSSLTGESIPREVQEGCEVLSGFINLNGFLKIRVTKSFENSMVNKILSLVEGLDKKTNTERFITKFSRFYTPLVVLLAFLIAFIIPIFLKESFLKWIYRALIFLVVSCPCALVISIPLGFFAGIGRASRNGILVKGSNFLEALNYVEVVVFDKTGTLTKGKLKVKDVKAKNQDKDKVLEYAAYAEAYSNHPVALCILENFKINRERIKDYKEFAGFGVKAKVDDSQIIVGNERFMEDNKVKVENFNEVGTKVYVAKDGEYIGCIIIADEIKEDAKYTIDYLKKLGKKVFMFTGDYKEVAEDVALKLGIDEYYYELLPEDKVEKLKLLKQKGNKVMFIGDGINDALAILTADVGVSMGALGQDAAIEASDVVLMKDDLKDILKAFEIAKKTKNIIWQNIILALTVKVLIMVLAFLGFSNMWSAVFADVGVTIIAVINSLRILK
ncbi:Cd2+/Zn2+-exporting ATPase [Caloramator fervidus]|uniref:Cd(2+)-exporting ATPase n=1 Tax=Caloramator fervidus TaxID=29344 RepID=A0A1H5RNX0_9CLOT|nr:Cd2+/Zn2+-exporting ATPase [Caloramator fervidus]